MATNKQIIEALKSVETYLPTPSGYVSIHRSIVSISNGQSIMKHDIQEITKAVNGNNGEKKWN